jgi:hypothetical protein
LERREKSFATGRNQTLIPQQSSPYFVDLPTGAIPDTVSSYVTEKDVAPIKSRLVLLMREKMFL